MINHNFVNLISQSIFYDEEYKSSGEMDMISM